MSGKWSSSNRRAQLPPDWEKRRQVVKLRAKNRCQAETHDPRCHGVGSECDHIGNPADHDLSNLQWLSGPCHAIKTQREAQAAKPKRKRQPERHPGRLT